MQGITTALHAFLKVFVDGTVSVQLSEQFAECWEGCYPHPNNEILILHLIIQCTDRYLPVFRLGVFVKQRRVFRVLEFGFSVALPGDAFAVEGDCIVRVRVVKQCEVIY